MSFSQVEDRIERIPFSGCWIWNGRTGGQKNPYGVVSLSHSKSVGAHRYVYELLRGPIPQGLHLDHLCMLPLCVNPDHLEPVTPKENARRWGLSIKECPQGHPKNEKNIGTVSITGTKFCRACHRQRRALSYALIRKGPKTTCAQGHPWVESNIYRHPGSKGHGRCRTCAIERSKKNYLKRKAEMSYGLPE